MAAMASADGNEGEQEALAQLILGNDRDLERLEDMLTEFNLFEVLGIVHSEVRHSALLAWLLDPRGSHGLRDYFLRGFLASAAAYARANEIGVLTQFDVDRWKLSEVEVATERHRIDILLVDHADGFVCAIENKIGSSEHSNQLSRYYETVEREYPELTPLSIFLTVDVDSPARDQDKARYVLMSYRTVEMLLSRAIDARGATLGRGVHNVLEQ